MEEETNPILRLVSDIRAKQDEDSLRLRPVARILDEVKGCVVAAMGRAGYASSATVSHGQDMDELREKVALLERRLAKLEAGA